MKKLLFGLIILLNFSCQNEELVEDVPNSLEKENITYENIPFDEKGKIMEKFGIGISKALHNQKFRELIKSEALKKFNKDYDVLYHSIKNIPINGSANMKIKNAVSSVNFTTLHNFLIPFFDSEQQLLEYEQSLPLLTIFVPELPLNNFSAENWDVSDQNQIPDVALRLDNITYVPVIGRDDDNYLIAPEDVPSWAIVVIKENERVVASTEQNYNNYNTRVINGDQFNFRFTDNNFDPYFGLNNNSSISSSIFPTATNSFVPQHLITAFNTLNPSDSNAWHRDFTYYNLTSSNQTSPLNGGKYSEFISTFRLIDPSPQVAYNRIADAFNEGTKRDPMLRSWAQRRAHGVSAWTDGSFDFRVQCFQGRRSTHMGISANRGFGAMPDELFNITWNTHSTGWGLWRRFWMTPRITGTKTKDLLRQVELSTWDLHSTSNEWNFKFEELDAVSVTTLKKTTETKFNANFSVSGEYKKIGFKFGASVEIKRVNEFNYLYHGGNDDLQAKDVHFRDNSIIRIDGSNTFVLRKHSTGNVEFSVVPLQVQN